MRVLVIGGSSSVGADVVDAFARRGDRVLATYARHEPPDAAAMSGAVRFARLDLEAAGTFESFVEETKGWLGAPDVVVFLAGILPGMKLADYTGALMQQVMTVNFIGQAKLIQLLLPAMANDGQMLLMSSVSGERGSFDPIYAASKAAIIGLTKSLAAWHGDVTRFNCLAPTLIEDTTMANEMVPGRLDVHRRNSPKGRLIQKRDVADAIVRLTEPRLKHLNGVVVRFDGDGKPQFDPESAT